MKYFFRKSDVYIIHMFSYFGIAVLVVLVIVVVYFVFLRPNDKRRRKRAEKHYQESAGVFDEAARKALDELTDIENPAPEDFFRRGNIVEYNILEGNVRARAGEGRGGRDNRRQAVGTVVRDYTDALQGMRGRIGEWDGPDPGFMIYRMRDFGDRALLDADDDMIAQMLAGFNDTVNTVAPQVQQEIIEERRERAAANAENREQAVDNYFEAGVKYTSDAQNVHDSKVNNDLRRTLDRLRETGGRRANPARAIAEIRDYIRNDYSRDPDNARKANDAMRILDMAARGERIGTFNETEDRILALTWERAKHPNNQDNADGLKEAIVNALADSMEHGNNVCINGRTARVLNSLAKLDYDDDVGNAMTFEAYKNQVLQESHEIVKREIQRARESEDEKLKAVGESYEKPDVKVDPVAEQQFKEIVKTEIAVNLDKYKDKLNEAEITQLKTECQAAID